MEVAEDDELKWSASEAEKAMSGQATLYRTVRVKVGSRPLILRAAFEKDSQQLGLLLPGQVRALPASYYMYTLTPAAHLHLALTPTTHLHLALTPATHLHLALTPTTHLHLALTTTHLHPALTPTTHLHLALTPTPDLGLLYA